VIEEMEAFIRSIAKHESFWDKKTREPVNDWYEQLEQCWFLYLEMVYLEKHYYPWMSRAFSLCRALGIGEAADFHEVHLNGVDRVWSEDEMLVTELDWRCQNQFDKDRPMIFEVSFPTADEIIALGIKTTMVPKRVYKNGVVQEVLF